MNTALEKLFGSSARVKMIRTVSFQFGKLILLGGCLSPSEGASACRQAGAFPFKGIGLIKQKDETIDEPCLSRGEPIKLKDGTIKTKKKNSTAIF